MWINFIGERINLKYCRSISKNHLVCCIFHLRFGRIYGFHMLPICNFGFGSIYLYIIRREWEIRIKLHSNAPGWSGVCVSVCATLGDGANSSFETIPTKCHLHIDFQRQTFSIHLGVLEWRFPNQRSWHKSSHWAVMLTKHDMHKNRKPNCSWGETFQQNSFSICPMSFTCTQLHHTVCRCLLFVVRYNFEKRKRFSLWVWYRMNKKQIEIIPMQFPNDKRLSLLPFECMKMAYKPKTNGLRSFHRTTALGFVPKWNRNWNLRFIIVIERKLWEKWKRLRSGFFRAPYMQCSTQLISTICSHSLAKLLINEWSRVNCSSDSLESRIYLQTA